MAAPYFVLYNKAVASSITAQGRDLTKTMDRVNEDYWYNQWHLDFELHNKMFLKNITQVTDKEHVSIYADTDSVDYESVITTNNGKFTIEEWYNNNIINGSAGETIKGHESVKTNDKILNWDNGLYYANVKRIIRHKVSKAKWKLKTKSGKEIIVTNDHSMIVFRDGIKLEVKPSEILTTDKVLVVNEILNSKELEYEFVDIDLCEQIGEFDDEYVYDVEVDDETHTFIANDILVHNSLFVSFQPAMNNSQWYNNVFNDDFLSKINKKFIILSPNKIDCDNPNLIGQIGSEEDFKMEDLTEKLGELLKQDYEMLLFDGFYIKDRQMNKMMDNGVFNVEPIWNWTREVDFIQGVDYFRYCDYFKKCLADYAESFGVENKEDFELERISESIISLAKKKYIQHIVYEDGIPYDRFKYIFPKGVELVRSSTPAFAREKIVDIVKYLFTHPDDFNIKELLKLVKTLRKEFELADIDDISLQSSCSNYEAKVINDKVLPLQFVQGAHFAVKAAAYYNYLLNTNKEYLDKYESIKSGTKIKYYYCKNTKNGDIFAYIRGSYPIEFGPEINFDLQFSKSILSPINSIIEPLGMPAITERLSVVMDIFSGFK